MGVAADRCPQRDVIDRERGGVVEEALPWRSAIRRRGTARRSMTAIAATSSGGDTIAPSAMAIGTVMPGTMTSATPATARVLASTNPIASDTMLPSFARKLRIGVKNAAK